MLQFDFGVTGQIRPSHSFPDAGFMYDFYRANSSTYTNELAALVSNNWLDSQTRAVLAHLLLYNPNLDAFVLATLTVEFSASGMAYPQNSFQTFSTANFDQSILLTWVLMPLLFILSLLKVISSTKELCRSRYELGCLREEVLSRLVYCVSQVAKSK